MAESDAKKRFEDQTPLCICFWQDERPMAFIESGDGGLLVGFLDSHGLVDLAYGFVHEDRRLFLGDASHYRRQADGKLLGMSIYYFMPPDSVEIEERDAVARTSTIRSLTGVDLSACWAAPIAWTELEELLERERPMASAVGSTVGSRA